MIYIKLEENMDKFMNKYKNIPRTMKKILFKSKCRNGKFDIQKKDFIECIVVSEINDKFLKKLEYMVRVRCLKNICISDNLINNKKFIDFANQNNLNIMNGKWLFKYMITDVVEYVSMSKREEIKFQEVSFLCNNLDEEIKEEIKNVAKKVRVCNIITNNIKQYKKLEDELYDSNGIILNISNNYKKAILKSTIIVNYDFSKVALDKCIFAKDADIINLNYNEKIDKRDWNGKNIVFYEINIPDKYIEIKEFLKGFNISILYESIIYKKTSYQNIKKEIYEDNIQILHLKDIDNNIVKIPNFILPKTIDKISI